MRHEPLYAVSVQGQPFTYPPFAALLFVPLQLLGTMGARWILTVASIGGYLLLIVVCARRLRMSPATAGLVGIEGLTFEPFARSIYSGRSTSCWPPSLSWTVSGIPARYRGMLIGLAAGIKLVPGAFIVFLALKREWGAAPSLWCSVRRHGRTGASLPW